jgi:hypothetical protein
VELPGDGGQRKNHQEEIEGVERPAKEARQYCCAMIPGSFRWLCGRNSLHG